MYDPRLKNRNLSVKDALKLAEELGCNVVHKDDIYIYPPKGTNLTVRRISKGKRDIGLTVLGWLRAVYSATMGVPKALPKPVASANRKTKKRKTFKPRPLPFKWQDTEFKNNKPRG